MYVNLAFLVLHIFSRFWLKPSSLWLKLNREQFLKPLQWIWNQHKVLSFWYQYWICREQNLFVMFFFFANFLCKSAKKCKKMDRLKTFCHTNFKFKLQVKFKINFLNNWSVLTHCRHPYRDSATRFFVSSFPQASDYTIRAVSNFFKNSRRYSQLKVCHSCQRHRWRMEKTFKQKNFNNFVWTPLGSRVNIYVNFCLQVHFKGTVAWDGFQA